MKQNDLSPLTLLKNVKIKYLELQTYTSTFSPPFSTMESKEASQVGSGLVVCSFAFPSISWPSSAFPSTTGGDSRQSAIPRLLCHLLPAILSQQDALGRLKGGRMEKLRENLSSLCASPPAGLALSRQLLPWTEFQSSSASTVYSYCPPAPGRVVSQY